MKQAEALAGRGNAAMAFNACLAEAKERLHHDLIKGRVALYSPIIKDDQGNSKYPQPPDEIEEPRFNAYDILKSLQSSLARMLSANATVDHTNAGKDGARADVMLGSVILLPSMPVTWILATYNRLLAFREWCGSNLPVLDRNKRWEDDPSRPHVCTTKDRIGYKAVKGRSQILKQDSPTTGKSYDYVSEDIPAFEETTRILSSALKPDDKQAFIDRLDEIIVALNQARERANMVNAIPQDASSITSYLFESKVITPHP